MDVAAAAANVVVREEEREVTEREEEMVGAVPTASGSLGCGQVLFLTESGQNSRILLTTVLSMTDPLVVHDHQCWDSSRP